METVWNGHWINSHVPGPTSVLGTDRHNGVEHCDQPPLVVVIGGSADATDALRLLASALPLDFFAPMLVALHWPPQTSVLKRLIRGRFPSAAALEGQPLRPGHVTFAPWNHHLVVGNGRLQLTETHKEHVFRPAIDPLFRTAAWAYRQRVIGVLLSGLNADGTAGLLNIVLGGGLALVQDPAEAQFPTMPRMRWKTCLGRAVWG